MPILLHQEEVKIEWADLDTHIQYPKPIQASVRAPGIHVSAVLKYIAVYSGLMETIVDSTLDEETMPLRMIVGMAWEDWAVGLYPNLIWQPGEVSQDHISGNPDGFSLYKDELMVEEFKATWISQGGKGKNILDRWYWIHQTMAYCYLVGSRIARLHVLFVNGDYRPPSPKYLRYTLKYSEKELERNWAMIVRNRDQKGVQAE